MAGEISVSCYSCNYPIRVKTIGERIKCPFCGQKGIVQEEVNMLQSKIGVHVTQGGVTLPTWLVAGFVGAVLSAIFWPSVMAATEAGSKRLAELSRQYIERKGK